MQKFTQKSAAAAADDDDGDEVMTVAIEQWKSQMSKKSPQSFYWSRVLDLEVCCLPDSF